MIIQWVLYNSYVRILIHGITMTLLFYVMVTVVKKKKKVKKNFLIVLLSYFYYGALGQWFWK